VIEQRHVPEGELGIGEREKGHGMREKGASVSPAPHDGETPAVFATCLAIVGPAVEGGVPWT
jgi:hypothetical protein